MLLKRRKNSKFTINLIETENPIFTIFDVDAGYSDYGAYVNKDKGYISFSIPTWLRDRLNLDTYIESDVVLGLKVDLYYSKVK